MAEAIILELHVTYISLWSSNLRYQVFLLIEQLKLKKTLAYVSTTPIHY